MKLAYLIASFDGDEFDIYINPDLVRSVQFNGYRVCITMIDGMKYQVKGDIGDVISELER